jgi:hypothetical protein
LVWDCLIHVGWRRRTMVRNAGQNLNVFMIFCENMYIGVFEVADYESKFKLKKNKMAAQKIPKKTGLKSKVIAETRRNL